MLCEAHPREEGHDSHGHILRTAHKLSATKIEHSHWSTGHSTHMWLADKRQTNLLALLYYLHGYEAWYIFMVVMFSLVKTISRFNKVKKLK